MNMDYKHFIIVEQNRSWYTIQYPDGVQQKVNGKKNLNIIEAQHERIQQSSIEQQRLQLDSGDRLQSILNEGETILRETEGDELRECSEKSVDWRLGFTREEVEQTANRVRESGKALQESGRVLQESGRVLRESFEELDNTVRGLIDCQRGIIADAIGYGAAIGRLDSGEQETQEREQGSKILHQETIEVHTEVIED